MAIPLLKLQRCLISFFLKNPLCESYKSGTSECQGENVNAVLRAEALTLLQGFEQPGACSSLG